MADFQLPGILDPFASMAMSESALGWISMGIHLIVATIVGGIILLVILKILESVWGEDYNIAHAFVIALVINVANIFIGFVSSPFASIPFAATIINIVVWALIIKMFLREMEWMKVLITAFAGFFLTTLIAPYITSYIMMFFSGLF
jgi:hypothetical protein